MKCRMIAFAAALAMAVTAFGGAEKCSCIKKAKSLSSSQSVTLVNEYDPEEKEYYDDGVAYYTVTLTRGQAYTIWIDGGDAASMDFDVDTNWEYYDKESKEDKEPGASFDVDALDGGRIQYAYLYADDWTFPEAGDEKGDYDPKSGKYVVSIYGDIGARTTLHFQRGIKSFTITGSPESPKAITFSNSWKSFSSRAIEGEYHFRATLKAGQKYRVRTSGGTVELPLGIDIDDGSTEADDSQDTSEFISEDTEYASDTKNEAYVIVPETTAKYEFIVTGDDTQKFKFLYRSVPKRAIAKHPAIPLLAENDYSAVFTPGRMSASQSYYDDIVDEFLCKIYLKKGERWMFETEGATSYQKMYAYNSSGKVLSTNEGVEGIDGVANDTRVVITATANGIYYVGACDPSLEVGDSVDKTVVAPVRLFARNVSELIVPDAYDPTDDVAAGANWIVPYPGTTNDWPLALIASSNETIAAAEQLGAIHRGHLLNANDMYDVFRIACRKGFTYRLAAAWNDENVQSKLSLGASVFFLNGKTERPVTTTGSLTPGGDGDFTFTPTVSGVHYVRVKVAEGTGLDFPGYDLYAMVANGTNALGYVTADLAGGVGTWSLNSESYIYPSGAVLALKAGTTATVKFNAVTGFAATPATNVVEALPVWQPGDDPVRVSTVYGDVYDKKYVLSSKTTTNKKTGKKTTTYTYSPDDGDATAAGAFAITPAATAATVKRTLWEEDPADTFRFTAAAGVYYDFTLVGSTNLAMVVSNATEGVVAESAQTFDANGNCTGIGIEKALLPAGVSYLIVTHGTETEGLSYQLTYKKAATGLVQFVMPTTTVKQGKKSVKVALDSFSVKEGSQYASLVVGRTGKEGVQRVRYATQVMADDVAAEEFGALAAQPGTNYLPVVDGIVSWAVGDKANKTIKIPLVPDTTAAWSASNRVFSVRLYPVDEYELAAGEYLAMTNAALASAVVKIVEASAVKPGTLALAGCGDSLVANAKKPTVSAQAGVTNTFTFVRTGGADGTVKLSVKTTTAKGNTAKAGVDYVTVTTNLVWTNGDAEPKTVDVWMPTNASFVASKTFTFSMAAAKGTHKATLAAKTATVTILNEKVAQTAAVYAKSVPGATPGAKLASTGTWFKDPDGVLRSSPAAGTVTWTLTGPGLFACEPEVVADDPEADGATLTCKIDKAAAFACDGRIVRVLGSGTHTVKFTVSGVTGAGYVRFAPLEAAEGEPYLWRQFSSVAPVEPLNKAYVPAASVTNLVWTVPEELQPAGLDGALYVRVRATAKAGTAKTDYAEVMPFAVGEAEFSPEGSLPEGATCTWSLDYAWAATGEEAALSEAWPTSGTATGASWTFTTLKPDAPITAVVEDAVDAAGANVAELIAAGEPIELIQFVRTSFELMGEYTNGDEVVSMANAFRFVSGALPKGMSVVQSGAISGVPTVIGETTALVQGGLKTTKTTTVKKNGKTTKKTTTTYDWNGSTLPVTFRVVPAGTAVGSFRAVLRETGGTFENDARQFGLLTFSVSSAGKISAKATVGGVSYSFSGTGYDEMLERDETLSGCTRRFRVQLKNTTKINKKTNTYNYLTVEMPDGALDNGKAIATAVGEVSLELNVANTKKTSYVADVGYSGELFRSSAATELGAAAIAPYVGYYTAGLAPEGVSAADGVPVGNGYLTFTVAASGSVKVAGVLADGTSVSCTTFAALVGEDVADPAKCRLAVPFFAAKTTAYSAAGVAEIAFEDPTAADALPVVLPMAKIDWAKTKSSATSLSGDGFEMSMAPTGGWYDKTENLQRHYLGDSFALSTVETAEELPTYALAKGYSFTAQSAPQGMPVSFVNNTLTPATRKLVKNATTGLYDTWQVDPNSGESVAASVNPWAVTFKFTRATGIISGTLSAWEWTMKFDEAGFPYATAQKEIKKLAHKGVWLWSRDSGSESPLPADAVSAGFFQMSGSKKWKASLPFNVLVTAEDEPIVEEKDFAPVD